VAGAGMERDPSREVVIRVSTASPPAIGQTVRFRLAAPYVPVLADNNSLPETAAHPAHAVLA